jgi:hypothetical protein
MFTNWRDQKFLAKFPAIYVTLDTVPSLAGTGWGADLCIEREIWI